jgi:hypothetical protein
MYETRPARAPAVSSRRRRQARPTPPGPPGRPSGVIRVQIVTSNWDRPFDASTSVAFDPTRYATSSYAGSSDALPPPVGHGIDASEPATAFRAPMFDPPPSFDFGAANAASAAHMPPAIATDSSQHRSPAEPVQLHSPGPSFSPADVQLVPPSRRGDEVVSDQHSSSRPSATASGDVKGAVRLHVHPHDIGPVSRMPTRHSCDLCRANVDPQGSFRCTLGCDFDVCTACFQRLQLEQKSSADSYSNLDRSAIDVENSSSTTGSAEPSNEDKDLDYVVKRIALICFGYIFGVMIIAMFTYGCTASAYMYSIGTTVGIWLGVFLPCAFVCGYAGLGNEEKNAVAPILATYCAGTWVMGLLVGLIGGIFFLTPWWIMVHLGTALNVDAAALDVIVNGTQPTSGIYHFQPTAFVNQDRYGYWVDDRRDFRCTAPIVSSLAQVRVVYWVTSSGKCCRSTGTTCWDAASSPGSISGAYLQVRHPEHISYGYSDARVKSCERLAFNTSYSAASICSLPTVYLKLDSNPEATRDSLYSSGMIYAGIMAGLWPCVLGIVYGACVSVGHVASAFE